MEGGPLRLSMLSEEVTRKEGALDGRTRALRGRSAVSQARLILLVMVNVAQLWILAATVEAALARYLRVLLPLVAASFVCWLITLSIILWWRPASRLHTSTGYVRQPKR